MINIAIDGPSGAGKSTIAKAVAKQLNIAYLDTGAMYRAIGLKADRLGIDVTDENSIIAMLGGITLDIKYTDGAQRVIVNGEDYTQAIRDHKVSKLASDVSKIPAVRLKLVEMQRVIAAKSDVVLDGRDITSFVLPNAKYKFYITATPEERATRRFKELIAKGQQVEYENILGDIIARDYNDENRSFAPLTRTADSIYIDTTGLALEESIAKIMSYIKE